MTPAAANELIVLSVRSNGQERSFTLQDGDERQDFLARFEEASGIRVLVCDDLCRWVMARGKLWALTQIANLLDGSASVSSSSKPIRLVAP